MQGGGKVKGMGSEANSMLPRHIAIVMDGNGRWAKKRFLPRVAGHKAGVDVVFETVKYCSAKGIEALTLFAFSSENWRRPLEEVDFLIDLFIMVLEREVEKLHQANVQLRIIGDRSRFADKLQSYMAKAEKLTSANTGLKLVIAANYGGQWDISEACRQLAVEIESGKISSRDISPALIQQK